eukprot:sb/3466617/
MTSSHQEPAERSKQPIRTRYLSHVTGYQPIRDYYLFQGEKLRDLCRGDLDLLREVDRDEDEEDEEDELEELEEWRRLEEGREVSGEVASGPSLDHCKIITLIFYREQEPTETSKQPIRTRYLGHVTGYQPIKDQYFLIRSASVSSGESNTAEGWRVSGTDRITSKQPIRTRYLGHVTGYQGPVFPDSVGSWRVERAGHDLHQHTLNTHTRTITHSHNHTHTHSHPLTHNHTSPPSVIVPEIHFLDQVPGPLIASSPPQPFYHTSLETRPVQTEPSKNRPKQVNNQSDELFTSRDWLSANQGPVFPDVCIVCASYLLLEPIVFLFVCFLKVSS